MIVAEVGEVRGEEPPNLAMRDGDAIKLKHIAQRREEVDRDGKRREREGAVRDAFHGERADRNVGASLLAIRKAAAGV